MSRERGLCSHCRHRGKLRGTLCVECYRAAADWFHGRRSVLDSPAVLEALPAREKERLAGELALRGAELAERLRRAGA